ncbi:hypothetical protein GF402_03970 [Candidatus Fermentibacteria bacterium]|nr:hypothetical protein [Candidatus Fermentibacteria bacterium]
MITGLNTDSARLETGIRRLIELVPTPGPVTGIDGVDLHTRTRAHNAYLRRRRSRGAESEVGLTLRESHGGIDMVVSGRADLIYRDQGGARVHEVKTSLDPPSGTADLPSPHLLQLIFYSRALLAEEPALRPNDVRAALVYVSPFPEDDVEPVTVPVDVFCDRCSDLWRDLLARVTGRLSEYLDRRSRQLEALNSFRFPYDELRPGQQRMIDEVSAAVSSGDPLLLRAPTGSGKTAAVLCGAVPVCVRRAERLFFLTAKNTQKRTVAAALERITSDLPVKALFLRSKDQLCPEESEVCLPSRCPRAQRFAERVVQNGSLDRLLSAGVIRAGDVLAEAMSIGVCPFELALSLSVWCEVIVCDYNYVYDPHIALRRFFSDDGDAAGCVVLLDEAANLPPRAVDYYSPRIRRSQLDEALSNHSHPALPRIVDPWRRLLDSLCDRFADTRESQMELTNVGPPGLSPLWREVLADVDEPSRALLDLFRACRDMDALCDPEDDRFRLILDRSEGDPLLELYCTDPSPELATQQGRLGSVVAFSATLSPADHYLELLGLGSGTTVVETEYPFPPDNLGVWVDPRVDTRYRARRHTLPLLSRRILRLYETAPGIYLVFMPSYRYLDMLAAELRREGAELCCQRRSMSHRQREDFFAQALSVDRSIVLTVSGGIFAEGIEFDSPHLRGAVVVGPSLPAIDLRRRMLIDRYRGMGHDGFYRAMTVPGITRAVQAAGRLVRKPGQRGVIVLMGSRYTSPRLLRLLPSYWLQGDGLPVLSDDLGEIASFWKRKRKPGPSPAPVIEKGS